MVLAGALYPLTPPIIEVAPTVEVTVVEFDPIPSGKLSNTGIWATIVPLTSSPKQLQLVKAMGLPRNEELAISDWKPASAAEQSIGMRNCVTSDPEVSMKIFPE